MKDIQQLIKKNNQDGRYKDIFPKTFLDAVRDRQTGMLLSDILAGFNMYFLSYVGSKKNTRLQVPEFLRRRGLIITYVTYDNVIVTERYKQEDIDDITWGDDNSWDNLWNTSDYIKANNAYGFNVTVFGINGGRHTIETAILDVPYEIRVLGHKITFAQHDGTWATYQLQSMSLSDYTKPERWVKLEGITNTGSIVITNQPDEEDITVDRENLLKFADKEYSEDSFSGLGRVYLRKNIVDGKNILTQEMISKSNTRYIIQYDYDLNGTTITIPENCVLEFQGGSLGYGILTGNNTKVYGVGLTETVTLAGTFNKVNFCNFKINDDISLIITTLLQVVDTVNIPDGEYNARTVVTLPAECSVYGQSLKTVIHAYGERMFSFTTYGFRRTIANLTLIGTGETENIPDSGNPIPGTVAGTTSQIAITMSEAHETHIYNMEIDNFMRAINVSLNCWETHMHDIRIRSCDEGIFNGTWTREENMMEYNRISCMYCGIGFQFYNGYLQTLNGCRAELCNTGIKIGGTLNQVNIINSYLERNHNRSIWFMSGSASATLIDGCYFALNEYTQTWDGKPDKINDIYFEENADTNNVTIKNCWFNPLGTSLVEKENFYILNTNNKKPIVLENNIYKGASGTLKLFSSNQYLSRLSNKDFKQLYHNWENWLSITDTEGVIDLSSYPLISSNFIISFSDSGKELTSIEVKMPIVSNFLTDQRYEDIVYNLMIPYTDSSIGNVQYIKFTQVSSTSYMPIQHVFVKGSKNGGRIIKLRLVTPLEGGAQWRLFSEDVETYSNSVPQSQVVLPSRMTDDEKSMFAKRSLWFTTATPEYIPTYFDGTYWRKWNGDRALNTNGFYLHTSGDSENLPRVESIDTNFRFFNTDYSVGLIYNGTEWVNEDGTLFNKVNII
jgi:hypothetical protein